MESSRLRCAAWVTCCSCLNCLREATSMRLGSQPVLWDSGQTGSTPETKRTLPGGCQSCKEPNFTSSESGDVSPRAACEEHHNRQMGRSSLVWWTQSTVLTLGRQERRHDPQCSVCPPSHGKEGRPSHNPYLRTTSHPPQLLNLLPSKSSHKQFPPKPSRLPPRQSLDPSQ